jgi:hypothetical protein
LRISIADEHVLEGSGCYGHGNTQVPMVRKFGDLDRLNETAFRDRAAQIEETGGVDAIVAMETFEFTPVE